MEDRRRRKGSHPLPRFVEKIRFEDGPLEDECWIWTASTKGGREGVNYAQFYPYGRHPVLGHHWSYWFFRGRWGGELHLDHLCRNTLCVNPHHLDAVSHVENEHRKQRALNGDDWTPPDLNPLLDEGVSEEPAFDAEAFEERAAILEYDAGYPRVVAERRALAEVQRLRAPARARVHKADLAVGQTYVGGTGVATRTILGFKRGWLYPEVEIEERRNGHVDHRFQLKVASLLNWINAGRDA